MAWEMKNSREKRSGHWAASISCAEGHGIAVSERECFAFRERASAPANLCESMATLALAFHALLLGRSSVLFSFSLSLFLAKLLGDSSSEVKNTDSGSFRALLYCTNSAPFFSWGCEIMLPWSRVNSFFVCSLNSEIVMIFHINYKMLEWTVKAPRFIVQLLVLLYAFEFWHHNVVKLNLACDALLWFLGHLHFHLGIRRKFDALTWNLFTRENVMWLLTALIKNYKIYSILNIIDVGTFRDHYISLIWNILLHSS